MVIFSFVSIYVFWGMTYLGIRWALDSVPPFTIGTIRYLVAGAILLVISHFAEKGRKLDRKSFVIACASGILTAGIGNGLVMWGEQAVASSVVAFWVASVPLWVTFLNWMFFDRVKPSHLALSGLLVGFTGVCMLSFLEDGNHQSSSLLHVIGVLIASLSWSYGSLVGRGAKTKGLAFCFSAWQMIAAGIFMTLVAGAIGEWQIVNFAAVTARSWASIAFLCLIGSVLTFTAFSWLMNTVNPTLVSTYALVNPLVALFFGVMLLKERLSVELGIASALILTGVAIVLWAQTRLRRKQKKAEAAITS